jgi:hypothetical protein
MSEPQGVGYRPFAIAAFRPRGRNLRPRGGVSSVVSIPSTRIVQAPATPARGVEILGG